jgi:hypothetical protein
VPQGHDHHQPHKGQQSFASESGGHWQRRPGRAGELGAARDDHIAHKLPSVDESPVVSCPCMGWCPGHWSHTEVPWARKGRGFIWA